jgi:hypothetical protein
VFELTEKGQLRAYRSDVPTQEIRIGTPTLNAPTRGDRMPYLRPQDGLTV